jgi:acetyl esterase/lipase
MPLMRLLTILLLTFCLVAPAWAQKPKRRGFAYPPKFPEAQVETYKTIGDTRLDAYLFYPPGHKPTDKTPAIVFFFGGGWTAGSPAQFYEHCKYLADRGMVAIAADYRVASRHGVKADACVSDAKSAIRWVRKEASRLGIDPHKIAAGGGSAGGHIAACTGVVPTLDESSEDKSISSVPDALVLFNPALVLAPVEGSRIDEARIDEAKIAGLKDRTGVPPIEISPYHQVKKGAPPTIIFHGQADTTVPINTAQLFTTAMTDAGNQCRLVTYPGQSHGFFNFGRGDGASYHKTVQEMDDFLVAHKFLPPKK